MINFRTSIAFKALYLAGIMIDMFPHGITLRSQNKYKRIILCCLTPIALLWGLLIKCYGTIDTLLKDRRPKKYKLAIAAIAKNESEYIEEWLAFHKIIGVKCVFLYDNDSTDNMKDFIQPYIDEGFVVYNTYPGKCKQIEAYNDALKRYGSQCKYLAYIDCDEFIIPIDSSYNVIDQIDKAFRKDMNAGGIGLNWAMFGSSGHKKKTPGLVTERFLYRCKTNYNGNMHIKSIVKPLYVNKIINPHYAEYHKGHYGINLNGEIIGKWYNPITEFPSLRINHYFTKSKEEWDKRRSMGKADMNSCRPEEEFFYMADKKDVRDELMLRYSNKVKVVMAYYHNICKK